MDKITLFSSEAVTPGHPDKICDAVSDAVLDALLSNAEEGKEKDVRCACETMIGNNFIALSGEYRGNLPDVESIARRTVANIGYTNERGGFDPYSCVFINNLHHQSDDIALGVDRKNNKASDELDSVGAGDQGIIYGYACNETPQKMPLGYCIAQDLCRTLTAVREKSILPYLRPDGKSQVTLAYVDGKPKYVSTVVVSSQHADFVELPVLKEEITKNVILPVINAYIEEGLLEDSSDMTILVNPTGRFVVGGPEGDSGVTGRKIVVDSYGGFAKHGGGAYSGKDATKVDRSAAYAARWVAKTVVSAGFADQCEVQLGYVIGVNKPVSVNLNCFGSEKVDLTSLEEAVKSVFDLRPAAIQRDLDLFKPVFQTTTNFGHFGKLNFNHPWENVDSKVSHLRDAIHGQI